MGDIFFFGKRGHGKTASAMWELLFDWYDGNEIWSNTPLHKAFDTNYLTQESDNLHVIDTLDLLQMLVNGDIPDNNKSKTLLLDEILSQASARNFGSWVNKNMATFVSQARKREFKIIYTAQLLGAYDKWLRLMTDRVIQCIGHGYRICECHYDADIGLGKKNFPEPVLFEQIEYPLDEDLLDTTRPIERCISRKTMRYIYPLYDTKKIIVPVEYTDKYQELVLKK